MGVPETLSKVLYVDLSNKSFTSKKREDLFEKYLGGAGVASQLLLEECPEGVDPYDPEAPIILAVGPLTGLLPLASKTVAVFKSPLTKNFGESHAGGRSAIAIRMAGFGAIVIKGASKFPIYISIHDGKVFFKNAETLWGMSSCVTVGSIIRQQETNPGLRTIMRIGMGGENLVSYASVTTETYRHFGRLGLGAVFGSKKLKAIVVSGQTSLPVEDKKGYRKLYDHIYNEAVESPVMKKYHDLGTAGNVSALNKMNALPTRNLQSGSLENADKISGEYLAENYLGRRIACGHCPVGCIHLAALREPYEDEPYFFKTTMISYDFELIYALGSTLGITDPENMLRLIDSVEKPGLDAMSTGVVLAWATEALERGIVTTAETDGLELKWGDHKAYMEAINKITSQPNDFYKALAKGVAHASSVYGGEDFALAFGGNEMAGYHTGPAAYLNYLLGARNSHLDSGGYGIDQEMAKNNKPLTPKEVIDKTLTEEYWRQILSGMVVCFFARGIYTMEVIKEALRICGMPKTEEEINEIGREIHALKYKFKKREGFKIKDLKIAKRAFETKSPSIEITEEFMREALDYAEKKICGE